MAHNNNLETAIEQLADVFVARQFNKQASPAWLNSFGDSMRSGAKSLLDKGKTVLQPAMDQGKSVWDRLGPDAKTSLTRIGAGAGIGAGIGLGGSLLSKDEPHRKRRPLSAAIGGALAGATAGGGYDLLRRSGVVGPRDQAVESKLDQVLSRFGKATGQPLGSDNLTVNVHGKDYKLPENPTATQTQILEKLKQVTPAQSSGPSQPAKQDPFPLPEGPSKVPYITGIGGSAATAHRTFGTGHLQPGSASRDLGHLESGLNNALKEESRNTASSSDMKSMGKDRTRTKTQATEGSSASPNYKHTGTGEIVEPNPVAVQKTTYPQRNPITGSQGPPVTTTRMTSPGDPTDTATTKIEETYGNSSGTSSKLDQTKKRLTDATAKAEGTVTSSLSGLSTDPVIRARQVSFQRDLGQALNTTIPQHYQALQEFRNNVQAASASVNPQQVAAYRQNAFKALAKVNPDLAARYVWDADVLNPMLQEAAKRGANAERFGSILSDKGGKGKIGTPATGTSSIGGIVRPSQLYQAKSLLGGLMPERMRTWFMGRTSPTVTMDRWGKGRTAAKGIGATLAMMLAEHGIRNKMQPRIEESTLEAMRQAAGLRPAE